MLRLRLSLIRIDRSGECGRLLLQVLHPIWMRFEASGLQNVDPPASDMGEWVGDILTDDDIDNALFP